jgi:hypothetical protein
MGDKLRRLRMIMPHTTTTISDHVVRRPTLRRVTAVLPRSRKSGRDLEEDMEAIFACSNIIFHFDAT